MLLIDNKHKAMSTSSARMFGEATVALAERIEAMPAYRTSVPILNALRPEQRVSTLLATSVEAIRPSPAAEYPTVWIDASVIATFSFIADVLHNQLPDYLLQRSCWVRTMRFHAKPRRITHLNLKHFDFDAARRVMVVCDRFLNAQWQSSRIPEGLDCAPRIYWAPRRTRRQLLPAAFWDSPPPMTSLERQAELRTDIQLLLAPGEPAEPETSNTESSANRVPRRVRI